MSRWRLILASTLTLAASGCAAVHTPEIGPSYQRDARICVSTSLSPELSALERNDDFAGAVRSGIEDHLVRQQFYTHRQATQHVSPFRDQCRPEAGDVLIEVSAALGEAPGTVSGTTVTSIGGHRLKSQIVAHNPPPGAKLEHVMLPFCIDSPCDIDPLRRALKSFLDQAITQTSADLNIPPNDGWKDGPVRSLPEGAGDGLLQNHTSP